MGFGSRSVTGGATHDTALLLLHGFPLNRRLWQAQTRRLAQVARACSRPTCAARETPKCPRGHTRWNNTRTIWWPCWTSAASERAIVAGLSMGGYIAFEFWRRYPDRVEALVLCDTRAEPDDAEGRANRDRSAQRVREIGVEAFVREMMPRVMARESLEDTRLAGRALALMSIQTVEGIVGALEGMRDRPDSRPTLSTIDVPVLLVFGEAGSDHAAEGRLRDGGGAGGC